VTSLLLDPASYLFNPFCLPPFFASVASLLIGVVAVSRGRNQPSFRLFLLSLAIFAWFFSFSLMYCCASPALALVFARMAYLGVPFIPSLGFSIALGTFSEPRRGKRHLLWGALALSWVFSLTAIATKWLITGVRKYWWGYYPSYGMLSIPFLAFFAGIGYVTYQHFLAELRAAQPGSARRRNVRFMVAAYLVVAISLVDFIPKYGVPLYPIGYLPFFAFLIILSRSIWSRGLLPITPAFAAESILETMTEALLLFDPEGNVRFVNGGFCRLFGCTAEEALGAPLQRFLPAELPLTSLTGSGLEKPRSTIEVSCSIGGRQRWLSVSVSSMRDRGNLLLARVCLIRDVSDRRRAEQALRESEERYRSFLQTFQGLVYRSSIDGSPIFLRGAVEELTGYRAQDFETGRVRWEQIVHPEDLPRLRKETRIDSVAGLTLEREYRILPRRGEPRWVHEFLQNVCDSSGRPALIQGIVHDITDRRQLEERLEHSQKLESIGRLAGGMAHDFNNILTSILGYSELLHDSLQGEAEKQERVQEIRKAVKRAASLTSQLLTFSRKQVHQPRTLRLNDLLSNLRSMLETLAGEHIRICYRLAPDLGPMRADPGQIEQVIVNLVVNAKDAMPEGGTITIQTANTTRDRAADGAGPHVLLRVSDTGHGMDRRTLARVFEPFFTTKEPGKGTGLGLSMVYGIVKQSDGQIEVTSEPGQGSTFRIYFPRVNGAAGEAVPRARRKAPGRGQERILLVEDEPTLREVMGEYLRSLGYQVQEAENGQHALQLLEQGRGQRIDLLVTDVVMPEMGGPELASCLLAERPELNVLYISGYTNNAALQELRLQRPLRFLQKPFTPYTLAGRVRDVLDTQDQDGEPQDALPHDPQTRQAHSQAGQAQGL
jgi:PAS domain S-box-containing protein